MFINEKNNFGLKKKQLVVFFSFTFDKSSFVNNPPQQLMVDDGNRFLVGDISKFITHHQLMFNDLIVFID